MKNCISFKWIGVGMMMMFIFPLLILGFQIFESVIQVSKRSLGKGFPAFIPITFELGILGLISLISYIGLFIYGALVFKKNKSGRLYGTIFLLTVILIKLFTLVQNVEALGWFLLFVNGIQIVLLFVILYNLNKSKIINLLK
jgi:hypothetical protein